MEHKRIEYKKKCRLIQQLKTKQKIFSGCGKVISMFHIYSIYQHDAKLVFMELVENNQ